MKHTRKFGFLLAILILTMGILTACQTEDPVDEPVVEEVEETETTTEEVSEGTRTIVDHAGNEVELPAKIEKVVIDRIPILSTYMAYHEGAAPYIVGYAGSLKEVVEDTVLADIAPELIDTANTVYNQTDINIEEIIKLDPDVIFYNAMNTENYEQLSKTGIPCVGFATIGDYGPADPIDRYGQWLQLLEEVFDEPGKMDDFLADGQKIVDTVAEKIDTVAEEDRPSGMILWKYEEGSPIVSGKGTFGDFWLQRLGVKNVAGEEKGYPNVPVEQVYQWNPDILYLNGPGLLDITTTDALSNSVEGFDMSSLKAYEDGRIYNSKLGMWNWFTPNPDAPLVLSWLAQSTYPEVFEDMDLEPMIKEYYQKWYNYELTDEEVRDMSDI